MDTKQTDLKSITIKEYILKHRTLIISLIAIIVLLILIIALVNTDSNRSNTEENELNTSIVYDDTDILESIVSSNNKSEIKVISNKNNEQADLIFDSMGISLKDIYAYSGSIDPRTDFCNTIMIIRPKAETYNQVKVEVEDYVSQKQQYFMYNSELKDGAEAKKANSAIITELHGYIILVMCEDSNKVTLQIIDTMEQNSDSLVINTTDDMEEAQ